jgi:phosphatidate phosphatase PAH1
VALAESCPYLMIRNEYETDRNVRESQSLLMKSLAGGWQVIMSPDRLMESAMRELIYHRPQDFKIPALTDIQ